MRAISKLLMWLAGILLVVAGFFQALAMIGVTNNSENLFTEQRWLLPMWIAFLSLLLVSFLLTAIFSTHGKWPILFAALALIGALISVFVALSLREAFPAQVAATGGTQGLTTWRLIYRHFSPVLVGVLIAAAALLQFVENRAERRRYDRGEPSHYDLSGAPLFKDSSTLDLPATEETPRKLKGSRRAAARKEAEENGDN